MPETAGWAPMGGVQGKEGGRGSWEPGFSSGSSLRRNYLLFQGSGQGDHQAAVFDLLR